MFERFLLDEDLGVGVELVVESEDHLLVELEEEQNFVKFQDQIEETLEFTQTIVFVVDLGHLFLFYFDCLQHGVPLLHSHQNPVEPQEENGQHGHGLHFDKESFSIVKMVCQFQLDRLDDLFFSADAEFFLDHTSALQEDNHYVYPFLLPKLLHFATQG